MIDLPSMAPHSSEAEQSVLGAVLLDNAALLLARQVLTPEDFYLRSHQTIFHAMLGVADRGGVIDNLTLSEALLNTSVLKEIGGSAYLGELLLTVASAANITHHARIVAEKSKIRHLRHSLRTTLDMVESGSSVAQVTAQIEQLQRSATHPSAGIRSEPDRLSLVPWPLSRFQFLDEPEATQLTWIWDEFLAEGGLSALVAKPKVGKTTVVVELPVKWLKGGPSWDEQPARACVDPRHRRASARDPSPVAGAGAEELENLHIHAGRLE